MLGEEPCLLIDAAGVCLPVKEDVLGSPVSGIAVADPDAVASFAIAAKYWITFLVFSVLPAPDSPLRNCPDNIK